MTTQLERDIEARVNERLMLWIRDSIELHRMAGLDSTVCYPVIAYSLIQALVGMFIAIGLERDEANELLREIMDGAYARARR